MNRSLACLLLAAVLCAPAWAAAPSLLKLEYTLAGKPVSHAVPAVPGSYASSRPGEAPARWHIGPGDAIKSAKQPADRTVGLYRRGDVQDALVGRLDVRYFRNAQGYFVPHFQIRSIPLVYRDKDGWKPIPVYEGRADLIMLVDNALPNAEGYYPSLDFTLGAQPTPIDVLVVE